ncbi:MAG: alpha/beta hydrolase [Bacteroidetes bacterium]|nr:alpha/beta hydrolase [Bacteroidota bacterium]
MKPLKIAGLVLGLLTIIYLAGPRPAKPVYQLILPTVPSQPDSLERYVQQQESKQLLKLGNEARIVWDNDSLKNQTEFAIIYLHGFSASQMEGDPVHRNIAKKFGYNLYLSRLDDHGVDTSAPLSKFTAVGLWNSALEALAIGKKLGKKVVLISTSTGGTLALKLAAEFPEIAASFLFSPNIEINDNKAWLLNNPWGYQIAKSMVGEMRTVSDTTAVYARYWNYQYRTSSVVQLQQLLETTMKASLFEQIKQPTLLLYYFKNEQEQDPVVKVSAMKRMFRQLGTPDSLKSAVALPKTGDHVLASPIKSKDVAGVEKACTDFAIRVLHWNPQTP